MANTVATIVYWGGVALTVISLGVYNNPRVVMATSYSIKQTPSESSAFENEEVKEQFSSLTDSILDKSRTNGLTDCIPISNTPGRRSIINKIFEAIDDPAYSSENLITRQEMENALANQQTIERLVLGR